MKNIIFTILCLLIGTFGYSQMKIFSNGKATFGQTGTTALSDIHISQTANPTLRLNETPTPGDYFEIRDQGEGRVLFDKYGGSGYNVLIDYNPRPFANTSSATFRFFRYTDASFANFIIFEGKNSVTINSQMGSAGDTYFNAAHGDVALGINSPLGSHKLHVEGTAYKTSGGDLWSVPSDRRLKQNINKYTTGLDIINKINTVEYEYNGKCGTKKGDYQIGVIAQELREIAPFMVSDEVHEVVEYDEEGIKTIISQEDILTINASSLKWLLVNAVQEQQTVIEDQNEVIDNLTTRLNIMEEQLSKILNQENQSSIDLSDENNYFLGQNKPNPFTDFTSISYKVPEGTTNASIEFYNMEGKVLKTFKITSSDDGTLDVNSKDLPSGIYSYRLVVNNSVIGTKKMVKNR